MAPARLKRFAHAIDFFPTIASAAVIEVPNNLPGINLLDAGARTSRQRVFGVTHSTHNMTPGNPDDTLQYLWCVEERWKLIVRYHGQDTTRYQALHAWDQAPVRLYDIQADPHEKNELTAQHPDVVARLKQEINTWALSLTMPGAEER